MSAQVEKLKAEERRGSQSESVDPMADDEIFKQLNRKKNRRMSRRPSEDPSKKIIMILLHYSVPNKKV